MPILPEDIARCFYQVSYVVQDLEKAQIWFRNLMGVNFEPFELSLGPSEFMLRGKPAELRISGALGDLPNRGVQVELIRPGPVVSIYNEFLQEKGPGLHHLAFMVPDYLASKNWFQAAGLEPVQEGISSEGSFCFAYFDCGVVGASMIEVVWLPEAARSAVLKPQSR